MPQYDPIKFLLNRNAAGTAVSAPAYSLTKVLAAAAVIVGPLATALVDSLGGANLTDGQYVTLTIALLAFLAILVAADVLARSYVTAHIDKHLYPFAHAVPGHHANHDVQVLGAIDTNTFLVLEDETLKLVPKGTVRAPDAPQNV